MNRRNQTRLILFILGIAMYGWTVMSPANQHIEGVPDIIKTILAMSGFILVLAVVMDIDTTSMKE